MFNTSSPPPVIRNPFLKRLVTIILLLNLLVAAIVGYSLQKSKTHYENQAKVTTRNISRILDENIAGVFEKANIALQVVCDETEHQLRQGTIGADSLDTFIIRQHSRLPELISLRVTNAAGDAIYGAKTKAATTINLAHRDYFVSLRDNPSVGIVISKPIVGGISGKWMVILARRINRPDGTFAGLVYAGIGLEYLTSNFSELNVGAHGVITLLDADLSLVVRHPEPLKIGANIGQKVGSRQLLDMVTSGKTAETYKAISSVDGMERVFSYRKLSHDQPFYIVTGLSPRDYLAGWRMEALELSIGWVLFCLVTVVFATLFYREWHRTRMVELGAMESEQRFRSFVENANDLIYTLSPTGIITSVAPNVESLLGYLPCELIGTSYEPLIHRDDLPACKIFLEQAFESGTKQSGLECRIRHKNNTWLWLMSNTLPVTEITTGERTLFGVGRDINDRKRVEEALQKTADLLDVQKHELQHINESLEQRVLERTSELQESSARFNQLAEQSSTVVWEMDATGLLTYVSHVSEAVFGYHPDEVTGKMHFFDIHPESVREAFKQTAFAVMKRKESLLNVEHAMQAKDGRIVWVSTSAIPRFNADGSLRGYRGSDTDITESKALREQLIQSQKMETIGQLAGGLAHDFNNVLSIINGYCCVIQIEAEPDDQLNEYVGKIVAASGRAAELTHSLLAFSRTQVMNPRNQNLNIIVSTVASFVKRIIGENIQCNTAITTTPLPVYVDGGQIEQALINLCTNARDAMPDGGDLTLATDSITIDEPFIATHNFGTPGRFAVITASDSGNGMDETTKKKLFEPFFTTKEVGKGTGLGLSMVYGIIKQHNGFIDVVSTPGTGARFILYLPIVASESMAPGLNPFIGIEVPSGTELILVVEDDADLREFMYKILVKYGYQVLVASDGQAGVDTFRDNADTIKLVIMDIVMPRKGGTDAYGEMLQIRPGVRALFNSGYSINHIQQQAGLGEYAEFIVKPVQPTALMKKVREMLDR